MRFSINDILIRPSVECLSGILTCFFYCRSILLFRVQASVASTLIFLNKLPLKLNPIIRPIMDSIKKEEQTLMQVSLNAVISQSECSPFCSLQNGFWANKAQRVKGRRVRDGGVAFFCAFPVARVCLAIRAHFALTFARLF